MRPSVSCVTFSCSPIKGILISSSKRKKIIYNNLKGSWKSQGSRFASCIHSSVSTSSAPLVLQRRCLASVHGVSFVNSVGRSHQEDLICQLTHGLDCENKAPYFLLYFWNSLSVIPTVGNDFKNTALREQSGVEATCTEYMLNQVKASDRPLRCQ